MKILKIPTLVLALTVVPLMNANATNISAHAHKAQEKVSTVMSDTMITAKVKELMLEDPSLAAFKIHVTTKNQIVTLSGKVDSKAERNIAINLAKSVHDVKYVNSKLKVLADA